MHIITTDYQLVLFTWACVFDYGNVINCYVAEMGTSDGTNED